MIINNEDNSTNFVGEDVLSQDFEIDKESIGLFFKGFSDSLYSDKFGSIVREIASNCVDSHIEAGVNDPFEVELYDMNDDFKIIFRDFGVGLSPDRIKNIYSKYFASTKRSTNDQIGGFGIGAKSPLAYTAAFSVVTRFQGVKYHYMVHRGNTAPRIELLDKSVTTERNGTEIRIDVQSYSDYVKFENAIKTQLKYFDSVKIIGSDELNHDYKIYKSKNWIHRTGSGTGSIGICIGNVYYKLSGSALDKHYFYDYQSKSNVDLYFNVGEIPVTMSRESIEYTAETVKKIEDKIDDVIAEFEEYLKKNSVTDDFKAYIEDLNLSDRNLLYKVSDAEIINLHSRVLIPKNEVLLKGIHDAYPDFDRDFLAPFYGFKSIGDVKIRSRRRNDDNFQNLSGKKLFKKIFKDNYRVIRVREHEKISHKLNTYLQETSSQPVGYIKLDTNNMLTPYINDELDESDYKKIFQTALNYVGKYSEALSSIEINPEWEKSYLERQRSKRVRKATNIGEIKVKIANRDYSNNNIGFKIFDINLKELRRKFYNSAIVYGTSKDVNAIKDTFTNALQIFGSEYASFYSRDMFLCSNYVFIQVPKNVAHVLANSNNTFHISEFETARRRHIEKTIFKNGFNSYLRSKNVDIPDNFKGFVNNLPNFLYDIKRDYTHYENGENFTNILKEIKAQLPEILLEFGHKLDLGSINLLNVDIDAEKVFIKSHEYPGKSVKASDVFDAAYEFISKSRFLFSTYGNDSIMPSNITIEELTDYLNFIKSIKLTNKYKYYV